MNKLSLAALLIGSALAASAPADALQVSFQQMSSDVDFLASDQLNGRGNFSKDIDKAADYIAKRFEQIGLQPFQGDSYLQRFRVYTLVPDKITLSLNGQALDSDKLAVASTMATLNWHDGAQAQLTVVKAEDNLSQVLSGLNKQGGQHLVLIDPSHSALFKRYQNYFGHGLTKLSLDKPGAMVLALTDQTKISNLQLDASIRIENHNMQNVVGMLPATKTDNSENVLFSAHYDHLGGLDNGKADHIYNGADDDASGTTAVIELADYYKQKADNRRNLIFVAFTAEEIGGFGSRYFSEQLNPDDITAMFNIEMIGKPSKFGTGTLWMTGMQRSNLGTLMNETLSKQQRQIHDDPYPEQDLFYRSDNATLARLGVPAHSFSSTQLDKDQFYHQASDEIATLDKQSMHQVIETIALGADDIVAGKVTPSRIDKAKVRSKGLIF